MSDIWNGLASWVLRRAATEDREPEDAVVVRSGPSVEQVQVRSFTDAEV